MDRNPKIERYQRCIVCLEMRWGSYGFTGEFLEFSICSRICSDEWDALTLEQKRKKLEESKLK